MLMMIDDDTTHKVAAKLAEHIGDREGLEDWQNTQPAPLFWSEVEVVQPTAGDFPADLLPRC